MSRTKLLISVFLCLLLLMMTSSSASASSYRYTFTSFRYIGEFLHDKAFGFLDGEGFFRIQGRGTAEGRHEVHSGEKDGEKNTNIDFRFFGTTDPQNALDLVRMEKAMINHLETKRAQDIAGVDNMLKTNINMTADDYELAMKEINRYYDSMIQQVKSSYGEAKKNVRLISEIRTGSGDKSRIRTSTNVGVEMNPGESGYIEQRVSTNKSIDGEFFKSTNRMGNTGGITAKDIEVELKWESSDGFKTVMSEQMVVEGYAEIWESTEVRIGNPRGGGWSYTMP